MGALDQENRRERAEIDPPGSRDPSLALDAFRIGLDRILVQSQESQESIDGCRWVGLLRFMKPKFVGATREGLGESTAGGDRRENARFRRPERATDRQASMGGDLRSVQPNACGGGAESGLGTGGEIGGPEATTMARTELAPRGWSGRGWSGRGWTASGVGPGGGPGRARSGPDSREGVPPGPVFPLRHPTRK